MSTARPIAGALRSPVERHADGSQLGSMTPQERDLECLLRVRSKDESGLEALYDAHGAILYGVALRILRSASDAEDAVQETWAQVWKSSASYDARRGSVAAWLMTIVRTR